MRFQYPLKHTLATALAVFGLALSPSSHALSIAQVPLFLTTAVQPNLLLLLDDSGSMVWENLVTEGAQAMVVDTTSPNNFSAGFEKCLASCTSVSTFFPANAEQRLRLCHGYNGLAYNPALTYTPWKGKDNAGITFQNAYLYGGTEAVPNFTTVRQDPYNAASLTTNLTALNFVAYYTWTDGDRNGDGDNTDPGEAADGLFQYSDTY
ncbi:MAG: hypothetical protein ACREWG_03850, partial [Gammaproteobacteria bacterium]